MQEGNQIFQIIKFPAGMKAPTPQMCHLKSRLRESILPQTTHHLSIILKNLNLKKWLWIKHDFL